MSKGQVSFFIISGIVGVLGIILIIYLLNVGEDSESDVELRNDLQMEKQAIQLYFDACVYQKSDFALRKLGARGGQLNSIAHEVDLTPFGMLERENNLGQVYYNKMKVAALVASDGYGGYDVFTLNMASLQSELEHEITDNAQANLYTCLSNFDFFRNSLNWVVSGDAGSNLAVEVAIQDDGVTVQASYPLRFEKEGYSFILGDSTIRHPVKLGQIIQSVNALTPLLVSNLPSLDALPQEDKHNQLMADIVSSIPASDLALVGAWPYFRIIDPINSEILPLHQGYVDVEGKGAYFFDFAYKE